MKKILLIVMTLFAVGSSTKIETHGTSPEQGVILGKGLLSRLYHTPSENYPIQRMDQALGERILNNLDSSEDFLKGIDQKRNFLLFLIHNKETLKSYLDNAILANKIFNFFYYDQKYLLNEAENSWDPYFNMINDTKKNNQLPLLNLNLGVNSKHFPVSCEIESNSATLHESNLTLGNSFLLRELREAMIYFYKK